MIATTSSYSSWSTSTLEFRAFRSCFTTSSASDGQSQGDGVIAGGLNEDDAVCILVPGIHEGQHGNGGNAGGHQGQDDLAEQLPLGGAVDLGGLLNILRQVLEVISIFAQTQ